MMKTPLSVDLQVKRKNVRQIRRHLSLYRTNGQDTQGLLWKIPSNQSELYYTRMHQLVVVQRQEMAAYFHLLEDDLIQDFLRMDCCYKLTDKYLLAMAFVYFKRACFPITEYTTKNFFIALYLAITMEEDEEESKYEIFPWALGKNWRKRFPRFLEQRDKLWARIEYRAAVSRHCCEEVMAIGSSHFVWQRQRSDHHGGAQRQYSDNGHVPRGPSASPVFCSLCKRGTGIGHKSSPPSRSSAVQMLKKATGYVGPCCSFAPLRMCGIRKNSVMLWNGLQLAAGKDLFCKLTFSTFIDWMNE